MTGKKRYLSKNVYQAVQDRLAFIFAEFDNVYVSFSGGKDSGVLLNLALQYISEHNLPHKLGVFHLDYEAQYTATTEFVDAVFAELGDSVTPLRCCVPVKCITATSMHEDHWRPWEESKRDIWVRDLPSNHLGLKDFDFITEAMTDYEFQREFCHWWHKSSGAKKTCVLVGIRSDESLDRWRTIASDMNVNKYKGMPWTTEQGGNVVNAYPLYDWRTEDIWIANAKFGWSYNKLYDLYHYAGVPLHKMRVSSPFHYWAKDTLHLYRVIDPQVWAKMVSRVNGVNFTSIYGTTTAMGWKGIKKPEHFTWKEYMYFLLDTLPGAVKDNYLRKLESSKKSWLIGGAMEPETIAQLEAENAPLIRTGKTNNRGRKNKEVIQFDDYLDDTEVDDFRRIPTYKRMCVCIMKNDHVCKYMGFALTKTEQEKRNAALEKYKDL